MSLEFHHFYLKSHQRNWQIIKEFAIRSYGLLLYPKQPIRYGRVKWIAPPDIEKFLASEIPVIKRLIKNNTLETDLKCYYSGIYCNTMHK